MHRKQLHIFKEKNCLVSDLCTTYNPKDVFSFNNGGNGYFSNFKIDGHLLYYLETTKRKNQKRKTAYYLILSFGNNLQLFIFPSRTFILLHNMLHLQFLLIFNFFKSLNVSVYSFLIACLYIPQFI